MKKPEKTPKKSSENANCQTWVLILWLRNKMEPNEFQKLQLIFNTLEQILAGEIEVPDDFKVNLFSTDYATAYRYGETRVYLEKSEEGKVGLCTESGHPLDSTPYDQSWTYDPHKIICAIIESESSISNVYDAFKDVLNVRLSTERDLGYTKGHK